VNLTTKGLAASLAIHSGWRYRDRPGYDHVVVLNHLAAMLLFAGPLFYLGLWMAIDPAGIASLAAFPLGRRFRTPVRFAGVVLALIAIAI
jgi:hypothetical protein